MTGVIKQSMKFIIPRRSRIVVSWANSSIKRCQLAWSCAMQRQKYWMFTITTVDSAIILEISYYPPFGLLRCAILSSLINQVSVKQNPRNISRFPQSRFGARVCQGIIKSVTPTCDPPRGTCVSKSRARPKARSVIHTRALSLVTYQLRDRSIAKVYRRKCFLHAREEAAGSKRSRFGDSGDLRAGSRLIADARAPARYDRPASPSPPIPISPCYTRCTIPSRFLHSRLLAYALRPRREIYARSSWTPGNYLSGFQPRVAALSRAIRSQGPRAPTRGRAYTHLRFDCAATVPRRLRGTAAAC